jgi:hypothetical protein
MTAIRLDNQTLCAAFSTGTQGRILTLASGGASEYTTTSAGNAGGSTLVCTTLTAGSWSDTLVEFLSGTLKGRRALVLADNATGTLTIEDMPAQVESGVRFRLLDHPMPVATHDGGGTSTTALIDSTRTAASEPTNFWVGCYARCIYAAGSIVVGEMKKITAYAAATGDFTCDAFSANIADGDVFIIERPILAEAVTVEHPTDMIERNPVRKTNVPEQSQAGARRGATLSFSLPMQGDNTGANASKEWTRSSTIMPLLEACFGTITLEQGTTIGTGSSTSSLLVTTATRENFNSGTGGTALLVNGEARIVSGTTDGGVGEDTLALTAPVLRDVPATAAVVYAGANVRYASTAHYPIGCFEYWEDSVRYRFWACYGTVTFSTDAAGRVMANFSWQGQSWDSLAESMPVSDIHNLYPDADVEGVIARDTPIYLDSTEIEVAAFSLDPGLVVSARPATGGVEGSKAFLVTGCKPTFSVNPLKESDTYDTAVSNQTTYSLLAQFGSKPGNTVVFWMPKVQLTANGREDAEGYARNAIAGKAVVPASTDPLGEGLVIAFL